MARDFTYIDDLVEGIVRLIDCVPAQGEPVGAVDSLSPAAPFRVVNVGGGQPVKLMDFIATIEQALGRPAQKTMLPMQMGDVPATFAKAELLETLTAYRPSTPVDEGVQRFVDWYLTYHRTA